ncbi:peptide chain release factor N(5)-glutamine methyltransferase [Spiribacter sp. 221]|uniref:peptide chain release factor N(5)-glutamine methyltransferase n=1 Tax=Spiribacter onubensis TaxID=3122420 RepID=UPI00349F4B9B
MKPATLAEARRWGIDQLAATSPSAAIDTDCLLAAATDLDPVQLRAWPETPLDAAAWQRFRRSMARRRAGEPVAYLLGRRAFMDFELTITPAVLIPRPETEHLVEAALEQPTDRVLELGTGSGCIAIALARAWPDTRIDAVDRSRGALAVARGNADALGITSIRFLAGDWYGPVTTDRYGLIVSNPPYIADHEPEPDRDDARFEPRGALRAGADGLEALDTIIAAAPRHLRPGGRIWLEHGHRQAPAIRDRLAAQGFSGIESRFDLAGHERVTGGVLEHPA